MSQARENELAGNGSVDNKLIIALPNVFRKGFGFAAWWPGAICCLVLECFLIRPSAALSHYQHDGGKRRTPFRIHLSPESIVCIHALKRSEIIDPEL